MPSYYYSSGDSYSSGNRFSLFTPVIKTLMIVNVVVYMIQHWFLGLLTMGGTPIESYILKYCALQSFDSGSFFPWQLLTYQFMHGGFFHLFFNMFALWMFGIELESIWGSRRFVVFYLLCGMGAGLMQLLVNFALDAGGPTVGASGSINGVLLAFGFMFPDRPILMFPIFFPIPAKFFVLFWIAIDLLSGITGMNSGVAHFAHLGGALCGYLLLRFGDSVGIFAFIDRLLSFGSGGKRIFTPPGQRRKIYDIREYNSSQHSTQERSQGGVSWFRAQPRSEGKQEITQEQIDFILDKIAKSGYGSLSEEEKRILLEASKKL